MNFTDLYFPMVAAFVTASIFMEFLHFLLGLWLAKRQAKQQEAYYAQMAEKLGVNTEDFMKSMENSMAGGMGGMPMMFDIPGDAGAQLTASGTEDKGHGQYI
jgi:hypothetical protein